MYIIVLKWLKLNIIVIYSYLRVKLRFYGFLSVYALSRIKEFKYGLVGKKYCTQHYLVYIIMLKWLELKTIVIRLKLRAKLAL